LTLSGANFSSLFSGSLQLPSYSGCPSGYIATGIEELELVVKFNDGVTENTLPPMRIAAVPYARVADSVDRLMGRPVHTVAPTAGQVIQYNGISGRWEAS